MVDLYGCTDHGCIFGHRGGMGTNGGCQCHKELMRNGPLTVKAVRQLLLLRRDNARLTAALKEISAFTEPLRESEAHCMRDIADAALGGDR